MLVKQRINIWHQWWYEIYCFLLQYAIYDMLFLLCCLQNETSPFWEATWRGGHRAAEGERAYWGSGFSPAACSRADHWTNSVREMDKVRLYAIKKSSLALLCEIKSLHKVARRKHVVLCSRLNRSGKYHLEHDLKDKFEAQCIDNSCALMTTHSINNLQKSKNTNAALPRWTVMLRQKDDRKFI